MSKSSWTYYGSVNRVSDEHGRTIADLDASDFDFPEDVEHGCLFAAAPDLLAACKRTVKHIDNVWDDDDLMECWKDLSAAITKAEGGES